MDCIAVATDVKGVIVVMFDGGGGATARAGWPAGKPGPPICPESVKENN